MVMVQGLEPEILLVFSTVTLDKPLYLSKGLFPHLTLGIVIYPQGLWSELNEVTCEAFSTVPGTDEELTKTATIIKYIIRHIRALLLSCEILPSKCETPLLG